MSAVESYCIVAGKKRPQTLEAGQILKGSGQTAIDGKVEIVNNQAGDKIIPNRSWCWGKRVAKDAHGKIVKNAYSLDVTDKEYKGEIQFLKPGDPEGERIDTRWLSGYSTIDFLYQNVRLGYKPDELSEKDSESVYIMLSNGENEWSGKALETNRQLIQHLKYHQGNGSNEFRSADSTTLFFEKNEEQKQGVEDTILDIKYEAGTIVRDCGNKTEKLKVLYRILDKIVEPNVEDDRIYSHLKYVAETKPKELLSEIAAYKREVSDTIAVMESWKALDLSIDGKIAFVGQTIKDVVKTGELIAEDLDAKAGKQLTYLYDNMFDEKCFTIQFRLNAIAQKLKK